MFGRYLLSLYFFPKSSQVDLPSVKYHTGHKHRQLFLKYVSLTIYKTLCSNMLKPRMPIKSTF